MKKAYACFFLSAAMLLMCVAACPAEMQEKAEVMEAYWMERDEIRRMYLAELNQIISDVQADAQMRTQARKEKLRLLSNMEQESSLEAILCYMGYSRSAASVQEDSVYVAIQDFREADSIMVLEMILRETGQTPSSVRILPV